MGNVEFEFDYNELMLEIGFKEIGILIIEPKEDFNVKICGFIIKMFLILTILTF